jgi:hypothetical protein
VNPQIASPATLPSLLPGGHDSGSDAAEPVLYGLLLEFATSDEMVAATLKAKSAGYDRMDTFSPYPVGEAADALGYPKSEMGPIMFIGGLTGACSGFAMEYWCNAYGYPLNVGGRPYLSWPSFIPITFEMMVLTTALTGVFALMALCGLPRLNHPLFNSKAFDRATCDRFFLCIEAEDPKYSANPDATLAFAKDLHALSVEEVME